MQDLKLLYCDDALLAVDKPAGLLAVPGRGPDKLDCVAARLQAVFADARVVHRLDEATSGVMLFARGPDLQRALSLAFAERRVGKRYEAVVHGQPDADAGCVDLPLAADWPRRPRQRVDLEQGKPSRTDWRVLSRDPSRPRAQLALEPVTGRSHQLRVHLHAIGHPIVGDALYGHDADIEPRLLLHACELRLVHPVTGAMLALSSPVPF